MSSRRISWASGSDSRDKVAARAKETPSAKVPDDHILLRRDMSAPKVPISSEDTCLQIQGSTTLFLKQAKVPKPGVRQITPELREITPELREITPEFFSAFSASHPPRPEFCQILSISL